MTIDAYIIHLERATLRKKQVDYLCEILPGKTTILSAVDSINLAKADTDHYKRKLHKPRYPFELRKSEVACFLSHRKAWQNIIESGEEYALIVEDDVLINMDEFEPALEIAMDFATEDSFIRFPKINREKPRMFLYNSNGVRLYTPEVIGLGMQLQLVGRDAARKLLEWTEQFDRPVDTSLQLNWLSGVDLQVVAPSGISEVDGNLGGTTIGAKISASERIWREIARPIYRANLARLATRYAKTD